MGKQIITNNDKLHFYSEKEYKYNFDKPLREKPITYKILYPVAKTLVQNIKFKDVEWHGLENIPEKGGFILASNHLSGFDPITLTYCMHGKRTMFFMAKEEFFHTFYTKIPLLILGGFPVKRGTSDRNSLNFAIRVLKEGFGLMIFPQGTRDKKHGRPEPESAKAGIALIAREAKSDVVPVSIHRESDDSVKRAKLIIRFGKMIPYEDLGFTEGETKSKELRSATKLIMEKIGELWDMDRI